MSIRALQDYTYVSRYAHYDKTKKRRETWHEAAGRVEDMHLSRFPQLREEITWAFDQVRAKRVLGSQRALQFGGEPILKKHARLYNCTASYCDRMRFFQECFWLLLCGCGTGFSVQKHHVAKLPDFHKLTQPRRSKRFIIPDTIEGWSDALGILLATYMPHPEFPQWWGLSVDFDYSLIRPKGAPLSSGIGKAPGPEPLRRSLDVIRQLLERCNQRLRPIDCYDIVMHASDAVLSGGVRRSATICLFSPDDEEMVNAKTGDWLSENPQRARSNNSALLLRNETTKEQFSDLMEKVKQFGEPGFVWSDSTELVVNPCVEIGLYPVHWLTGEVGWEFCVASDTKLLTRNGLEEIGGCVGKPVEIWNGDKWTTVTPFQTGSDRKLYRVHLSDGSYLDCTANHRWLVKDRFMDDYAEVETSDLMSFSKYPIHTPAPQVRCEGGVQEAHAYEYGFVLGDACANRTDTVSKVRKPFAYLFGADGDLGLRCRLGRKDVNENGTPFIVAHFDQLDSNMAWRLKYEPGLPKEVFSWDSESLCDFIAGWADADGTSAGRGFRIYGRKDKMADLQMLMTKLGCYASLNCMAVAGEETNLGTRRHDVWYVQVSEPGNIKPRRVVTQSGERKQPGKGMYQIVERVEELPGVHDTFCVCEEEKHQCLFNNVLTKQCNLCEINGRKVKSREDFEIASRAASIIGSLQAAYTDFDYLGKVTKDIVEHEALLGVSITGMMDNPEVIFNPLFQREMAKLVLDVNEEISAKLGTNPCARGTCVKPAGTTSCILGTASGIHPHHAKRYFRRIQSNNMELPLQHFKSFNPMAVQPSVWSANGTDEVITFCIEVPDGAKTKNQIDAITLLNYVKLTQENWVEAGKREGASTQPWLRHNVSNTINVRDDEWDAVRDKIYDDREYYAGIALLPQSGDLDYPQAPMVTVHTPKEMLHEYGDGAMFVSRLLPGAQYNFGDVWHACSQLLGAQELEEPQRPEESEDETLSLSAFSKWREDLFVYTQKKQWLEEAEQFANEYFGGDKRKLSYCLKEVRNWVEWLLLTKTYQDVDYTQMIEEKDTTANPMMEWACSGNSCEMR